MDRALIVSGTEKSTTLFKEILTAASIHDITALPTCGEARRHMVERDFDLVLISAPLKDETGERLARQVAGNGVAQVILVVGAEYFDAISAVCESDGVLVVSKPLNRAVFWSALTLAKSAQSRVLKMKEENRKLKKTIEDIRFIDRAKYLLISHLQMSEQDAHRYIEKQAMDLRISRREVAERILKTYEM